jgi:FkbM family methyltransferase
MADHVYDTEYAMKEFAWGGETQLMDKLKQFKFNTIFDVGANIGEWAKMVLDRQVDAQIHSFEPVPEVFRRLVAAVPIERVMPNPFGLSSQCEMRDMLFDHDNDRLTTPCLEIARVAPEVRPLIMLDGDSYCRSRKVESIDFIKIDTEGHEFQVLKGFDTMLKNAKINIIQFEYGYANVLTKDLLIDFYKFLTPLNYSLGKLTPEGVDFKTYGLLDEDFKGPNFVAVLNSSPDIIAEIQRPLP